MKTGSNLTSALMIAAACLAGFFLSSQVFAAPQCGDPGCTSCPQTVVVDCNCGQPSCQSCAPAPAINQCGCRKPGCLDCLRSRRGARRACQSCESDCGCTQCPKCEGDICRLELDNSKVKKTCFKVEQKPVCIPPIRMPWMKCCPPGKSKTRLVSKLSTHKYECPNCSYKWTLQEAAKVEAPAAQPRVLEPTPVYDSYVPQAPTVVPQVPIIVPANQDPSANYRVTPRSHDPRYAPPAPNTRGLPWMSLAPIVRK